MKRHQKSGEFGKDINGEMERATVQYEYQY
jgi:hypothetical protein